MSDFSVNAFHPRPRIGHRRLVPWLLGLALSLGMAAAAHAGLGDMVDSVARAHVALRGQPMSTTSLSGGIVRYEFTSGVGAQVRLDVNTDGRVFAVGWSGQTQPDLRELLSSHYAAYAAVAYELFDANTVDGDSAVRIDNVRMVPEPGFIGHLLTAFLCLRLLKSRGRARAC